MRYFTLLVFSGEDEVIDTRTMRATTLGQARRIAEHIALTQPEAAGFQIWRKGARLFSTHPQQERDIPPPVALLALVGAERGKSSK